jgi:hypothetical protein
VLIRLIFRVAATAGSKKHKKDCGNDGLHADNSSRRWPLVKASI